MSFTPATVAALLQQSNIPFSLKLELRTNFGASEGWQEARYARGSLTIKKSRGENATLNARLLDPDFSQRTERSESNRCQLFADVRCKATLGAESEYVFRGRVEQIPPKDYNLGLSARCWRSRIEESQCEVSLSPTEVEVVADGSYRELFELAQEPGVFVLQTTGPGDEAFDETTSTIRRPWAPANTRVYYWDTDASDYAELAADKYQHYWTSGSVAIHEGVEDYTYYVSNLRCCKESAAAAATNVDWSQAVIQALTYGFDGDGVFAPELQGMALVADEIDISAVGLDCPGPYSFSGTVEDLILDLKERVADNLDFAYNPRTGKFTWTFTTQAASGNEDGTLYHAKSISQPRTIKQIVTSVVSRGTETQPVNQLALVTPTSICNVGANDYIKWEDQDTLDNKTFAEIRKFLTDGDSQFGGAAHNLPATEGGGTDKYDSWYGFCEWDLGEEMRAQEVYLVAGQSWHHAHQAYKKYGDCWLWPGYQLIGSLDNVNFYPIAPALDKVRVKPADRYTVSGDQITRPYLRYVRLVCGAYKHGNYNFDDPSIGVLEIALICNKEYEHKLSVYPIEHAITDADVSADSFSIAGDYSLVFAVGEWFEAYSSTGNDGVYQVADVNYGGGYTTIRVTGSVPSAVADGLISPVYAYSDHTAATPHVWRRAHPDLFKRVCGNRAMHAITAADVSADSFSIADATGDLVYVFADGEELLVAASTGNDGRYTVSGTPVNGGGTTVISVAEAVADGTADGYLSLLGCHGGHRGAELDFAGEFTSSKGRDAGIQHLAESVRLFDSVTYSTFCDVRFEPGQTVIVNDSFNGNVGSILIEEIEIKEHRTTYYGTNYLAEALGNS